MAENKKPKNSAARIRANNKYNDKTYDRINIAIKKGGKEKIQAAAAAVGESINSYVINAILKRMESGK